MLSRVCKCQFFSNFVVRFSHVKELTKDLINTKLYT